MNALVVPPFPTNPQVGQIYGQWVWNGSAWVNMGPVPVGNLIYMLSSGTYWPSPGLTYAIVEIMGAGGGGGGAVATLGASPPGWITGGGGGSGGSYGKSILPATLLLNGVVVTIGQGGAGGVLPGDGQPGAATSFGAYVIAPGGLGGHSNNASATWGSGGAKNQAAVTATVYHFGSGGGSGGSLYLPSGVTTGGVMGGQGGGSAMGGQGQTVVCGPNLPNLFAPGQPGGIGCGGDGGASGNSADPAPGGVGGNGACVITEFCFGATSVGGPCPPASGAPCWPPNWGGPGCC